MSYADPDIKQTSKYLRIESGEPHDLRLLNEEPVETFEHFSPAGSITCKGEEVCEACQSGDDAQQKFMTNVFDHGTQKVRLWKYGVGIAKMLKAIAVTLQEEDQSIMNVDLKVEATGANKQKKYTITPRMTSKPVAMGLRLYDLNSIPF